MPFKLFDHKRFTVTILKLQQLAGVLVIMTKQSRICRETYNVGNRFLLAALITGATLLRSRSLHAKPLFLYSQSIYKSSLSQRFHYVKRIMSATFIDMLIYAILEQLIIDIAENRLISLAYVTNIFATK